MKVEKAKRKTTKMKTKDLMKRTKMVMPMTVSKLSPDHVAFGSVAWALCSFICNGLYIW